MGFLKIADILHKAKTRYPGFSKRMKEVEAFSRWRQAVGPLISKQTRPVSVVNNILKVEVTHSIWRSELHHRKNQILEILNRNVNEDGTDVIKDLFFVDPRKKRIPFSRSQKLQQGYADQNNRGDNRDK